MAMFQRSGRRFGASLSVAAMGLAAALLLSLGMMAQAAAADLWTVADVAVDGTGPSPSAAKEAALAKGRQRAWTDVFRRLTPAAEWTRQPPLTDEALEPLVRSFDISGERHSSTRYLATVTYVFNAAGVRDVLRKSGVQYSESVSKPVLVVALTGTAWQPETFWGTAWSAQSRRARLVPVAVPVGDAADITSLATVSQMADWNMVKPLADRYGAGSVLVAALTRSATGFQVSTTHIRPDSRVPRASAFARQGTEDDPALAMRAAGAGADTLQDEWKRTTSVEFSTQSTIMARVPFRSLQEWVAIRRTLEGTRAIQRTAVEEMTVGGARLRLDHVGRVDQLQTTLAQSNVTLSADDKGQWTITRNAASPAAAGTNPVVP
ncbi:MAG: DUF2066 domain-containing protein [Alphaproteobacteria bacterium]